MKNSDEMVHSLFERRDRYIVEQKKKKAIITRTITSMCCVCLIALVGFGMWQGGMFSTISTAPPDQTVEDAPHSGVKDNFGENNSESHNNPTTNNLIVINTVDGIAGADRANIALMVECFVEMSREEMINYYGVDYIPDVPADIKPWEDERSGIYKRNGGTGEVYWDADILNYSNEDFTRSVHVEVDKGSYVLKDYLFFKGTEEKSIINNFEVLIGLSENGYYYSEFMYNGVGFCISANGVTEEEFVAIIASIIE